MIYNTQKNYGTIYNTVYKTKTLVQRFYFTIIYPVRTTRPWYTCTTWVDGIDR